MKTCVLKCAGSGHLRETKFLHRIPWLNYRRFQIDPDYFNSLVEGVIDASSAARIAIVPGGTGAYLFIGLGRELGLDEAGLSRVGCQIVDVIAGIIRDALLAKGAAVCPDVVSYECNIESLMEQYRIVVVRSSARCHSTDALAAATAVKLRADKLLIFKQGVPIYHVGFERPTEISEFKISMLERIADEFGQNPGENAILDRQCIDLIKDNRIVTCLYNALDSERLAMLIEDDGSIRCTRIIIEE